LNDRQTRETRQRSDTDKYRNICRRISFGIELNDEFERAERVSSNDQDIFYISTTKSDRCAIVFI